MKNKTIHTLCGVLLASVLSSFLFVGTTPAFSEDFQVVVHEDRPEASLSRKKLSRLFLRQITRWDDGSQVAPLDQAKGTDIRDDFLLEVHDKDEGDYAKYWVRLVFTGKGHPPDEIADDAGVLGAVAANKTAIGYVSSNAKLPPGVKTIEIED